MKNLTGVKWYQRDIEAQKSIENTVIDFSRNLITFYQTVKNNSWIPDNYEFRTVTANMLGYSDAQDYYNTVKERGFLGEEKNTLGYKQVMGLDLIAIEQKLIKEGYKVKSTHDASGRGYNYFTAENSEGAQVYCQVNNYGMGYDVSSKYKPCKNEGSGRGLNDCVSYGDLYSEIILSFKIAKSHADRFGYPEPL